MRPTVVLAGALALAALANRSEAQRERYAPLILQLPIGARATALGGGPLAVRDVESVFGSPALVGGNNALAFGAGRYESGATSGFVASAFSIGSFGIGVGVQMLDVRLRDTDFPMRSEVLTHEGAFAGSSLAATIAGSMTWKGYRWGVAGKYVEERISEVRAGGVAADVGVVKDLSFGNGSVGLTVQNIGRPLELGGDRQQLPTRATLGAAAGGHAVGKWIDLGGNVNVSVLRNGFVAPSGGFELLYVPIEGVSFAGRVGARRPELRELRPLTLGFGASLDRVAADYAWEQLRSGGVHKLTLRLR
jgi:hypothetical protein